MIKKIFLLVTILVCAIFVQAQIPADSSYPIKQNLGKAPNTVVLSNAIKVDDGFINSIFVDTTTANLFAQGGKIKFYPLSQIGTYKLPNDSGTVWIRNGLGTKWLRGSGSIDITSFTFDNDTTGTICFANGSCTTFGIFNLFNVVTNIIQNFSDSSIFNINDSTLLICHGQGAARVCDTIHLGNSNTYYFLNDSTLVSCDTVIVTCVGDSCYQTQLCDTTIIPGQTPIPGTFSQNWLRKIPGTQITEFGSEDPGDFTPQMLHDTYSWTNGYQWNINGRALGRPIMGIQQSQWANVSSSIIKFNHQGNYEGFNPSAIDNLNPVNLYINYIDPILPGQGVFAGDTIGFMGAGKYGYAWMTNSQGDRAAYVINDMAAKQVGVYFDTYSSDSVAVAIFGNQVPKNYAFSVSPFPTTTLADSRIAVFKTTGQQQDPRYTSLSSFPGTPQGVIGFDTGGNFITVSGAGTSTVNIITDTSIQVCNLNGCDTFTVNIDNPTTINIYNDTTIIICNEAGSCDTITVNNYTITNGQVVNIANTVFVAKSGNDGTGTRQRLDLPFLTIRAAMDATFPGDVIMVFPGVYETTSPIKLHDSVNFQFMGAGEVRLLTSVSAGYVFDDSSSAVRSVIDAPGWKIRARSNQRAFNFGAASNITIYADEIISATGMTLRAGGGSIVTVHANKLYGNALAGAIWLDSCVAFYGTFDIIQVGVNGNAIWTENVADVDIRAKRIFAQPNNDDFLIHVAACNATDSLYFEADEIRAGTNWAIWAVGESPYVYLKAKIISAKSDCVVTSSLISGGALTVEAQMIADTETGSIDGVVNAEGGLVHVIGATIRNASAGPDLVTKTITGDVGRMTLNAVVYDTTKVSEEDLVGTITRVDRDFWSGISGKFIQATTAPYVMVYGQTGRELQILPIDSVGGITGITADNGLTASTATNVQLGSTSYPGSELLHTSYIDASSYPLWITSTSTGNVLQPVFIENRSGGFGLFVESYGGSPSVVARFLNGNSTNNDVEGVLQILREPTGGVFGAAGIGGMIEYRSSTTVNLTYAAASITNQLISKWVVPTDGSGTSQFDITGIGSGSNNTIMSAYGSGVVGIGKSSAYGASRLHIVNDTATAFIALIESNSTTAAGGNQQGLRVILQGANANSSETTVAIQAANYHSGTSSTNFGIAASVTSGTTQVGVSGSVAGTGTSAAIYGTNSQPGYVGWFQATTSGTGLFAETASGSAIIANSNSGKSLVALANGSATTVEITNGAAGNGLALYATVTGSGTNTVLPIAKFSRTLFSGTAAAGIGGSIDLEDASNGGLSTVNQIVWSLTDATHATRTSTMTLKGVLSAATVDLLTLAGDGSVKLRPITATAASAITPAEGMLVFVSDTNGTFVSIGIWSYQNGAWKAL